MEPEPDDDRRRFNEATAIFTAFWLRFQMGGICDLFYYALLVDNLIFYSIIFMALILHMHCNPADPASLASHLRDLSPTYTTTTQVYAVHVQIMLSVCTVNQNT